MTKVENEKFDTSMNDEILVPLAPSQSFSICSGKHFKRVLKRMVENNKNIIIFYKIYEEQNEILAISPVQTNILVKEKQIEIDLEKATKIDSGGGGGGGKDDDDENNNNNTINNNDPPREVWSKKLDFLMSIIGFSVDLAGVWRLLVFLVIASFIQ